MTPTDPTSSQPAPPEAGCTRRKALMRLVGAFAAAATVALAVPLVGYLVGALLRRRPDEWTDAGHVREFPIGQTRLIKLANPLRTPMDGVSGRDAAYVRRRSETEFLVFAVNCTHLGCPVSWFAESGLFLCPCHGGVYYEDGTRASGPPPRGLYHLPHRVVAEHLEIKLGHLPTLQEPG